MGIKKNKGIKVLVCGSKEFQDRAFVYGVLDKLKLNVPIGQISSGSFTGVAEYAREWAEEHGISYKTLDVFDDISASIYDNKRLPPPVIQKDPTFAKVQEKIVEAGLHVILPCPNKEGKLGPTTSNIVSIAECMGVKIINGEKAYQQVLAQREAANQNINTHKKHISGMGQI